MSPPGTYLNLWELSRVLYTQHGSCLHTLDEWYLFLVEANTITFNDMRGMRMITIRHMVDATNPAIRVTYAGKTMNVDQAVRIVANYIAGSFIMSPISCPLPNQRIIDWYTAGFHDKYPEFSNPTDVELIIITALMRTFRFTSAVA